MSEKCDFAATANALNLLVGRRQFCKDAFIREPGPLFQPRLGGTISPLKVWQVYSNATQSVNTDNAFAAIGGIAVETASTHALFITHYIAGTYGTSGQKGGVMYQNGTHYWADQGKSYDFMLHYYYDNSSSTGTSQLMGYFLYP